MTKCTFCSNEAKEDFLVKKIEAYGSQNVWRQFDFPLCFECLNRMAVHSVKNLVCPECSSADNLVFLGDSSVCSECPYEYTG